MRVQKLVGTPLSLAEVQIFADTTTGGGGGGDPVDPVPTNLSPGGVASQSSTAAGGVASRAVDGNTSGVWGQGSVTLTASSDGAPWWQVELAEESSIDEITLFNRTDCCSDRLTDFVVFVSNTEFGSTATLSDLLADDSVWSFEHPGTVAASVTIPVGAVGQYVRVWKVPSRTEFLYTVDDMRVRRSDVSGAATFYHADGTEYSVDGSGGDGVFTYYHQMSGRTVGFTKSDSGVTTWMFSDVINSTAATRDENGVTTTARYTPWGETRGAAPELPTDHTFTGQIADRSTGLSFYNARYYDPIVGRFVSPDTIVPEAGNGQDYNRYSYVMNNPIRWDDPTGHCVSYEPCTGSDDEPTTTDLSNTSFGGESSGSSDGSFWSDVSMGFATVVEALPGGTCVVGVSANCDPNAGTVGDVKRGVLEVSYGITESTTGLGDEFAGDANNFNRDSGLARVSEAATDIVTIPFAVHPATATGSAVFGTAVGGLDSYSECRGGFDSGCGLALVETGTSVAPFVGSRAVNSLESAIYADDAATNFLITAQRQMEWETAFNVVGEVADTAVDAFSWVCC